LAVLGAVVVLGTLMAVVDTTIVNVATRTLGAEFGVPISTIQWVLTGYLLVFASVVPLTGWAIERFGAKRLWIGALLLFMTGSILSGLSWSTGSLIVFRIIQGIAGGFILPVGNAVLAQAAGPLRMGRALTMVGAPTMLGSLSGPAVGGLVISTLGWRWIFFVTLPLGAAALVASLWVLPKSRSQPAHRLDLRGLVLLCSGVAIFVYGMSEAGAGGGFGNVRTLAGLGAGVTLVALYVVHARARRGLALIDLSLMRHSGFAAAVATNLALAVALFGMLILLPLYWQIVRGESPLATGLLLAPQAFGAVVAMPLAGWVTDRVGAGFVVPVGVALALLGTGFYTQVGAHTPHVLVVGAMVVIGLGLGATTVPLMAAAYAALPHHAIPRATSALHVIRRLGASVGTAVLAIVLQRAIIAEAPQVGESALGDLAPAVRVQYAPALAEAFGHAFWVAFALIAAGLIPALLLPRRPPGAAQPVTVD
jgi:EmrB/QacA subfamily drug resistance transporter